jgi:tetratricopeptide (TPR) repeat protein
MFFKDISYSTGDHLLASGKYAEALEFFMTALSSNPEDAELHYSKGETLYWLGRWTSALEAYDTALKFDPYHTSALTEKARLLLLVEGMGRRMEALECLKFVLLKKKDDPAALLVKSYCVEKEERLLLIKTALENFELALETNPVDSRLLHRMGKCYQQCSDKHKAFQYFSKAAMLGNTFARGELADCYQYGSGVWSNIQKAFELFVEAANQGNPCAINDLADFYCQCPEELRDREQALRLYSNAGENIIDDMMMLPNDKRLTFIHAHAHKIRNGIILAKILNELPEEARFNVVDTYLYVVKSGRNIFEILSLLRPEEQVKLLSTKIKMIRTWLTDDGVQIGKIVLLTPMRKWSSLIKSFNFNNETFSRIFIPMLEQFPREKYLTIINIIFNILEDLPSNFDKIMALLPEESRLNFTRVNQTKIDKKRYFEFLPVIQLLHEKERFDFIKDNIKGVLASKELREIIALLPEESKSKFVSIYANKISDLILRLKLLPEEERTLIAVEKVVKIDIVEIPEVLMLLPDEKRLAFLYFYRDGSNADQEQLKSFSDKEVAPILRIIETKKKSGLSSSEKLLICSGQKIPSYYLGKILKVLPEKSRLSFASDPKIQIENGEHLAEIIPLLPAKHQFAFAIANVNLIREKESARFVNAWNSYPYGTHSTGPIYNLSTDLMQVIESFTFLEQLCITAKRLKNWKKENEMNEESEAISLEYLESVKNYFSPKAEAFALLNISTIDDLLNLIVSFLKNHIEIKQSTQMLIQGFRDETCIFSKPPIEIIHHIAKLTANSKIFNENEVDEIMNSSLRK